MSCLRYLFFEKVFVFLEVNITALFVLKLKSDFLILQLLRLHLSLVDWLFFNLCPNKMGLFGSFAQFEPKSPLHDGFYKVAVVSFADIYLKRTVILRKIEFSIDLVGIIYKKKKFFEFGDLYID